MVNLKAKSALVLGGAGGIGAAIIQSLCKNGLEKLAVIDIVQDPSSALNKIINKSSYLYKNAPVDSHVVLETAMKEASKEIGGFDLIINSAGLLNEQKPHKMIAINYGGVVNSTLIGIDIMRKDHPGGRGGVIMNIASLSSLGPHFILPIYAGTKHAVLGFTKSLVNEKFHQKTGVSFVSVCPGITTTAMLENFVENFTFPDMKEDIREYVEAQAQQPAEIVGETVIKALEKVQNGDVWVCTHGKIFKTQVPEFPYKAAK